MSTSAVAGLSTPVTSIDQRTLTAYGEIAFSAEGNVYPSGGFDVDFSTGLYSITGDPIEVHIVTVADSDYDYFYDVANQKLHIREDDVELSGTMPAALVGTVSPPLSPTEVVQYAVTYERG